MEELLVTGQHSENKGKTTQANSGALPPGQTAWKQQPLGKAERDPEHGGSARFYQVLRADPASGNSLGCMGPRRRLCKAPTLLSSLNLHPGEVILNEHTIKEPGPISFKRGSISQQQPRLMLFSATQLQPEGSPTMSARELQGEPESPPAESMPHRKAARTEAQAWRPREWQNQEWPTGTGGEGCRTQATTAVETVWQRSAPSCLQDFHLRATRDKGTKVLSHEKYKQPQAESALLCTEVSAVTMNWQPAPGLAGKQAHRLHPGKQRCPCLSLWAASKWTPSSEHLKTTASGWGSQEWLCLLPATTQPSMSVETQKRAILKSHLKIFLDIEDMHPENP